MSFDKLRMSGVLSGVLRILRRRTVVRGLRVKPTPQIDSLPFRRNGSRLLLEFPLRKGRQVKPDGLKLVIRHLGEGLPRHVLIVQLLAAGCRPGAYGADDMSVCPAARGATRRDVGGLGVTGLSTGDGAAGQVLAMAKTAYNDQVLTVLFGYAWLRLRRTRRFVVYQCGRQ